VRFVPRHLVNIASRARRGRAFALLLLAACGVRAAGERTGEETAAGPAVAVALEPGEERSLSGLRQLTFEGQNAEAYWSPDDRWIVFQATPDSLSCDQIFLMRPDGSDVRMISTGRGVTTCSYFLYPGTERILYSSTHLAGPECPPRPDHSRGYVWRVDPGYDVFVAQRDGSELRRLTDTPGYDAEATMSRDGSRIVFTSVRDGDLELYVMDPDGGNVRRLTDTPGYDGGAFFSYDGTKIVYRAHHPTSPKELADDRALLAESLVRPSRMEIWVMEADGSGKRQLTDNGAANFAPYFFPDGERVIFASNMHDPRGRNFDLYTIRLDGTDLTRVTFHPDFDAFPMFSADGTKLLWASNRNAAEPGDTNIFLADWAGR
jgi:Tol biopolymer transport system component